MDYTKKIKELLENPDEEIQNMGYNIWIGKLNTGNYIEWFYRMQKFKKTPKVNFGLQHLHNLMGLTYIENKIDLTGISTFMQRHVLEVTKESFDYHFQAVANNLYQFITQKIPSVRQSDKPEYIRLKELEDKIKALTYYAT